MDITTLDPPAPLGFSLSHTLRVRHRNHMTLTTTLRSSRESRPRALPAGETNAARSPPSSSLDARVQLHQHHTRHTHTVFPDRTRAEKRSRHPCPLAAYLRTHMCRLPTVIRQHSTHLTRHTCGLAALISLSHRNTRPCTRQQRTRDVHVSYRAADQSSTPRCVKPHRTARRPRRKYT